MTIEGPGASPGDAECRGSTGNDPEGPDEMTDLLTALRRSVETVGGAPAAAPRTSGKPVASIGELAMVLGERLAELRARRVGTSRQSPRLAGQIAEVEHTLLLIGGHR